MDNFQFYLWSTRMLDGIFTPLTLFFHSFWGIFDWFLKDVIQFHYWICAKLKLDKFYMVVWVSMHIIPILFICHAVFWVPCFNALTSLQDNLSFPLICPDWNADDEILLLEVFSSNLFLLGLLVTGSYELWNVPISVQRGNYFLLMLFALFSWFQGIEMYGLGNWAEVAEHVGTKNKEACIEHYRNVYLNSKTFPLPVWYTSYKAASSSLLCISH